MPKIKIDPADKVFSEYIRTRDGWTCQRCFKRYQPPTRALHASHYFGRGKESVRFDPMNVTSHCHGCHSYLTANPEEHRQWKIHQIGQVEFDRLSVRAYTTAKKDRGLALLQAKGLLSSLKGEKWMSSKV